MITACAWYLPACDTLNIKMRLALDIGNTRVKAALFDNHELVSTDTFEATFSASALQSYWKKNGIQSAIYSSTRHHNDKLIDFINGYDKVFGVRECQPYSFEMGYKTPETLGMDRIAAVAFAKHFYANKNCLIIDAGTCITYDILRSDGYYMGGNISPGLWMRLEAMAHFTGRLPLVSLEDTKKTIGKNTNEAILIGALKGAQKEVQGFVRMYRNKLKNLNVLLTGGDRLYFVNCLKSKIFAHPNLVPRGLNEILIHYEKGIQ